MVTDVIGRGDVESVPRAGRRRRRPPRLPRWVLVAAAALAAVAVVVVPPARTHLAREAATWLRATWEDRGRYDDARAAAIAAAGDRTGAADSRLMADVARAVDVAELRVLARMTDAIGRHRMWAGDLDDAAEAAVRAMRSELAVLRRDSTSVNPSIGYLVDASTLTLSTQADEVIAVATAHHHAAQPPVGVHQFELPPAVSDRLSRTTDQPTGLALLARTSGGRVLLDLDSGRRTAVPRLLAGLAIGRRVVGQAGNSVFLLDPRTGRRIDLARGRFLTLLGVDSGSIWVTALHRLRHFGSDGRQIGGWHTEPPRVTPSRATDNAVLVFSDDTPFAGTVWYPSTGRLVTLPQRCFGQTTTGGGRVVLMPCGARGGPAALYDVRSGSLTQVRVPRGVFIADMAQPISGDGRLLAVTTERGPSRAAVVHLPTGRFDAAPGPPNLVPVSWSPDGRWLLLTDRDSMFGNSSQVRIALWRIGSRSLLPVRLPADLLTQQPDLVLLDGR